MKGHLLRIKLLLSFFIDPAFWDGKEKLTSASRDDEGKQIRCKVCAEPPVYSFTWQFNKRQLRSGIEQVVSQINLPFQSHYVSKSKRTNNVSLYCINCINCIIRAAEHTHLCMSRFVLPHQRSFCRLVLSRLFLASNC